MSKHLIDIYRYPDYIFAETEDGWGTLDSNADGRWAWRSLALAAAFADQGLTFLLEPSEAAIKLLKLRWETGVEKTLSILGDHWERAYGDLEWRGIIPERILPWYFLVNDGTVTDGYGVKTGANALCYWQVDSEGVTLTLDVRCGSAGVVLGQRALAAVTIVAFAGVEGESPYASARRFCSLMCENPVLPHTPVYGGNNWYYAYGNSSHAKIVEDSKFISSLSSSANRPYMVIDDGWQLTSGGGICNGGPWIGNYLFPDMEALAVEMSDTGVQPGIWCRPLLTSQNVPSQWRRYRSGQGIILDPSVPEVLQYIKGTITQMSAWGYKLIKHDFTTFDIFGKWGSSMKSDPNGLPHAFNDRSRTTAEIIKDLYAAIKDAAGDSLIIGCNTISHLSAGVFHIQRTGDDTSGKSWERTRYMGINTLAFRMPQHETFYSHDADCVGITEHIPWDLNKQWLDLLAASGTPLFVSADPSIVTKDQRMAIEKAFNLASQPLPPAEPLDWTTNTCPSQWLLNGEARRFRWNRVSVDMLNNNGGHWWN